MFFNMIEEKSDAPPFIRLRRRFVRLPFVNDLLCKSLPDGFAAKPNRLSCAWRKKTRSGARVAPPKNEKSTPIGVLRKMLLKARKCCSST
jgi:hypothetical protein